MANPSTSRPQPEGPIEVDHEAGSIHLLRVIHLLRSAGGDLLAQAALHGRLVELEWIGEKRRLAEMLGALIVAASALLCMLIFTGILVLAVAWNTDYRIPTMFGLIAVYAIGFGLAWQRLAIRSAEGNASFAATRAELKADLAFLKPRL